MVFFVLLVVPLVVALVGFFVSKGAVTRKELALQMGVQLVVAGVAAYLVHYSSVHDTEVWNGSVVNKQSEHVSCSHSYSCHCRQSCSGSGKNRSCSEVCDTCYEHSYDVDWNVFTSNAEKIQIDRVNSRGDEEPPRFTRVVVGEPTTVEHAYTNYIKASPDSLFRHQGLVEKFKTTIPRYPEVYDYYRMHRLILVGQYSPDDPHIRLKSEWDDGLAQLNAEVGRPKQANIIIVIAKDLPQEYYFALEEAWIGAKKNDIVVVMGVDYLDKDSKYAASFALNPTWVAVMAWTTQEIFKVKLRDDIMTAGPIVPNVVLDILRRDITQYYVRKPMADFEYLEASITPTPTQWAISLGISLLFSVILTIVGIKYDLFGEERKRRLYEW